MNTKYFHDFIGMDGVSYRFEIQTNDTVTATRVEGAKSPFILRYDNQKKLTPVIGSQATIGLISMSNFQFINLHTDDMQGYMVKFYKAGSLFWQGWLDSELYDESPADVPPYPVSFNASDFNVMERLKYRDADENAFTGIVTLLEHLQRCLTKLALPFGHLYIGCTTTSPDITLTVPETILHKTYVQSGNFYDEDNEPMSCREVVDSILRPFGLSMVQINGDAYILDYNTIQQGLGLKRYDFATISYQATEVVNFNYGNLHDIGFRTTSGGYGFETMINNVKITSSLYAKNPIFSADIETKTLSIPTNIADTTQYRLDSYAKDANVENPNGAPFYVYTNKNSNSTLIGAKTAYNPTQANTRTEFRVKPSVYLTVPSVKTYLNIKLQTYVNTRVNPFDTNDNPATDSRAKSIMLYCNLYTVDESGTPLMYYENGGAISLGWRKADNGVVPQGQFMLFFANQDIKAGQVLNSWFVNSNLNQLFNFGGGFINKIKEKDFATGLNVELQMNSLFGKVGGKFVFEITNKSVITDPADITHTPYPVDKVKEIMFNNFSMSIKDADGEDINIDDFEFKSYINKKVASDYEDVDLKVISANTSGVVIGNGNILIPSNGLYSLVTRFTRAAQTDILERLLMCTIHSNFTTKNEQMSVDIKSGANPILKYVDYAPILSAKYLVTGCEMDFAEDKITINAVGYSQDVAKLSDLPYD